MQILKLAATPEIYPTNPDFLCEFLLGPDTVPPGLHLDIIEK